MKAVGSVAGKERAPDAEDSAVVVYGCVSFSFPNDGFCNVLFGFTGTGNDQIACVCVSQRVGELFTNIGAGGLGCEVVVGIDLGIVDGGDALFAIICLGEPFATFERS